MTDFQRAENFTSDMALTMTLTLSTKGVLVFNQFSYQNQMRVNFQKNVHDFRMTFNTHNDLAFDLDHDLEWHTKVKNIF